MKKLKGALQVLLSLVCVGAAMVGMAGCKGDEEKPQSSVTSDGASGGGGSSSEDSSTKNDGSSGSSDSSSTEGRNPSEGLEYDLNGEGTAYCLEDIGTCTDTEIVIPATYNGLPVTEIDEYAFDGCSNLTSVEIPDSVKTIGYKAFGDCTSLTSIVIGNSVTMIGQYAFDDTGYYNDESNWDNGVLYIGKYLIAAKNTIEGMYTIKNGTLCVANEAFYSYYTNTRLTGVVIPDSVAGIGCDAFYNCTSLTSIEVDENNSAYKDIDGNLYTKDGATLIQYAIGKTATEFVIPDGVITLGDYAFYKCASLTSVEIPDSVTTIGERTFSNSASLTNVEIPDSVTTIGGRTFTSCDSLISIEIPDSVVGGLCSFYGSKNLTSVVIGDGITWLAKSGFAGCENLKSVVIGDGVTSINRYIFTGCTNLASIEIGDGVTSVDNEVFVDCSSLTHIVLGDGITSINCSAFVGTGYYNDESNWENGVLYVGEYLIKARNTIEGVYTIKDGTCCIASEAFYDYSRGLYRLTSVIIPDSVKTIGYKAFRNCSSLTSITFEGTVEEWNAISKEYDWNYNVPATEVVCSDGTVAL